MRLRTILLLALCGLLAAGAAEAGKVLQAERLDGGQAAELLAGGPTRQDCQVGNVNPAAWVIGDWVFGAESYKYLFHAPETCSCPVGIRLENIHLLMQFGEEDVPASFDASVDLEEAVWDDLVGCYYPGVALCTSQTYTVEIETAGLYDISLPIFDECACAAKGFWYFLAFRFESTFGSTARPDLMADDVPLGCYSWNDYGFGWQDLVVDFGWPGEIMMYADAACCEFPVAAEPRTWGGVKSLYR